jgi:hypothetical protein
MLLYEDTPNVAAMYTGRFFDRDDTDCFASIHIVKELVMDWYYGLFDSMPNIPDAIADPNTFVVGTFQIDGLKCTARLLRAANSRDDNAIYRRRHSVHIVVPGSDDALELRRDVYPGGVELLSKCSNDLDEACRKTLLRLLNTGRIRCEARLDWVLVASVDMTTTYRFVAFGPAIRVSADCADDTDDESDDSDRTTVPDDNMLAYQTDSEYI